MKAIVKATHEVVELNNYDTDKEGNLYYYTEDYHKYHESELELLFIKDYDYWEKLKHQYAGMAMQQLVHLVNVGYEYVYEETAIIAMNFAHALVEKLKEKEERK